MKRIPALLFLALSAAISTPTGAQELDGMPAQLAGPALFKIGECVGFFVSDNGLALTTRSCLAGAMQEDVATGVDVDLPVDSPFLREFVGLSMHVVYSPPAQLAEFGIDGAFPSRRLDFVLIRVSREGKGLKTERYLPMIPSSIESVTDLGFLEFQMLADSAQVRHTGAVPRGFEHAGRLVPASTSFYDLMDAHHGGAGQSLPAGWRTVAGQYLPTTLNLVLEVERAVPSGSPLVTEHFEVAGVAFGQTAPGLPPRTLVLSISAIEVALDQSAEASSILTELHMGTRTTKSGNE